MNLIQLFKKFPTQESCITYLEKTRWGKKAICPYCKSDKTCKHTKEGRQNQQCWNCKKSFSVTVGTIFHHTHIDLRYWFYVIALMLNAKKGISACQVARDLDMRRPTVWKMMHKIRKAMETEQKELLCGIVEMDECYVGGKPKKSSKDDDDFQNPRGRGTKKECVVGIVERDGSVVVENVDKNILTSEKLMQLVRKNVDCENSILMTDEYRGYSRMKQIVKHETINHSYEYSRQDNDEYSTHTNTIEGFWSLLKRGIICLLYTSPSPRDRQKSRMPSSA